MLNYSLLEITPILMVSSSGKTDFTGQFINRLFLTPYVDFLKCVSPTTEF